MGSALNMAGFEGVTENYCVGVVCLSFWILEGHADRSLEPASKFHKEISLERSSNRIFGNHDYQICTNLVSRLTKT